MSKYMGICKFCDQVILNNNGRWFHKQSGDRFCDTRVATLNRLGAVKVDEEEKATNTQ